MTPALRRTCALLGALSLCLAAVYAVLVPTPARAANTTVSQDNLRTGWDQNEPGLSPSAVSSSDFGQLFDSAIPTPAGVTANQIYAEPISAGGSIVVASEENQVAALDPVTGAQRWSVNLGGSWPAAAIGCGDLTPDVGVTSTPVYDAATNTVYVSAKVAGPDDQHPTYQLSALDASTGAQRPGWPVTISGSPANDPGHPFNAFYQLQRPGLLLLNGSVYLAFSSHCDAKPYVGYVVGVNTGSRAMTLWSDETKLASSGAGIWQSGGGLVADGAGGIYLTTGNGVSPAPGPGNQPPGTLAESVVHLTVKPDGTLNAVDFFSPGNNAKLDQDDFDLGSGGPLGIPDGYGTSAYPHLLVQVGKDGRVFLLNRDSLGGNGQGPNGTDAVLNTQWLRGVWGHPAFWGGGPGYVYVVENGGHLQALRLGNNGNGVPLLSVAGNSTENFGFGSGSPIVTSSGTTDGSALVWVTAMDNGTGANSRLLAYDAVPVNGVLNLRYSIPLPAMAKFNLPMADNGRIYVATRTGHVLAFARPSSSALNAQPTDAGQVAVGATGSATALLSATAPVTVTSLSASAPFSVGPMALPVSLTAAQTLSVPVTFSPSVGGASLGQLTAQTSAGATYRFDLRGFGTQPGLSATPATADFGSVASGALKQVGISLQNNSTTSLTITSVTPPTGAFSAPSLPAPGTVVASGQSVTATVQFAPTAAGAAQGTLAVNTSQGAMTVPLTGTGVVGSPHLSISSTFVDFGSVATGTSATQSFALSNTGNVPLTITKAAPPTGAFSVANPLPEGQVLQAGDTVTLTVTFTPTTTAQAYGTYLISSDDGQGQQVVRMVGNSVTGAVSWLSGCVDVPSVVDGAAVVSNPCSGVGSQQVMLVGDSSMRVGGKCIGVKGGAVTQYAAIVVGPCDGSAGQSWVWRADDSVFNAVSGLCLSVPSSSAVAGTKLQLLSCAKAAGQRWWESAVRPQGVVSGVGGLCVGARGNASSAGTAVQLSACDGSTGEQVQVPGSSTLQIRGMCLDVTGSKYVAGTAVQLWTCNGGGSQQWAANADGTVRNLTSNLCLGTAGAGTAVGTGLVLATCSTSPTQQWTLPRS